MATFLLIVVAVIAIAVLVASRKAARRRAFEADVVERPLHPTIAATFRLTESGHWTDRQAAIGAARSRTDDVLGVLDRHREALLLVRHSHSAAFDGLLVVTQGRTIRYGRSRVEIPHHGAETKILAGGTDGNRPVVEIVGAGDTIHFAPSDLTEARLICSVIDMWADSPEVVPDPAVRLGAQGIEIDDVLFTDTLRRAGHPITPFNLRSIHERFGMQLHNKAVQYLGLAHGEAVTQRFMAAAARPVDDRDLPGWPVRVMREWSAFGEDIAPVAAFYPLWVRSVLLDTARTGGYLAHPEKPLCMWMSDWYDDGGRGARRRLPA
ncbi:hypothetical protein [Actinomycetospora soli]|uniref:hypothetical protein n=1 Tax=Actinomycetospora soli TaxID=2893887 RepID=UPI001E57ADED|nr:hypothetical protein [Actinomycetospora soli]MCD2187868.1 hypothetical protein [Actinomycetospora soli]